MFKPSMFKLQSNNIAFIGLIIATVTLSACKSVEIPYIFDKGTPELPKYGSDAIAYDCANYQTFGLALSQSGETAWIMFDDRQVNLNRDSADKNHYSFGGIDLQLNGDQTTVKDSSRLNYQGCKAKVAKPK